VNRGCQLGLGKSCIGGTIWPHRGSVAEINLRAKNMYMPVRCTYVPPLRSIWRPKQSLVSANGVLERDLVPSPFSGRPRVGYETLRCSFAHRQGSSDKGFERKPLPPPPLVASLSQKLLHGMSHIRKIMRPKSWNYAGLS
jgi:hypothetical protein